jgi:hypothetical protein
MERAEKEIFFAMALSGERGDPLEKNKYFTLNCNLEYVTKRIGNFRDRYLILSVLPNAMKKNRERLRKKLELGFAMTGYKGLNGRQS